LGGSCERKNADEERKLSTKMFLGRLKRPKKRRGLAARGKHEQEEKKNPEESGFLINETKGGLQKQLKSRMIMRRQDNRAKREGEG